MRGWEGRGGKLIYTHERVGGGRGLCTGAIIIGREGGGQEGEGGREIICTGEREKEQRKEEVGEGYSRRNDVGRQLEEWCIKGCVTEDVCECSLVISWGNRM